MSRLSTLIKTMFISSALLLNLSVSAQSITVEHALGTTQIAQTPQRVVIVGGHGSLDVLDELGIKPVGLVTQMLPEYLTSYGDDQSASTGSMKEANFENIFTLKPDLIIAEARMVNSYPMLSKIAPTVMYSVENGDYWNGTKANWRMLGKIFDKESEVETIIANTQQQMNDIKAIVEDKHLNTLALMNNGNNVSMFGHKSRFSVIFDEFGFAEARTSDTQNPHGNLISFEFIADSQPDVIFVLDRENAIGLSSGKAQELFDNVLVKSTPAYKNNRIIFLDANAWYLTIAGTRSTQQMIQDMAQATQ
ncbi:ferric anguibactin-binding protein [Vibrio sp. 10N.286.49.B3]|uniref:siderophore ABC transporter substrate-binding protein n=1 Tax=Vibrio sp. 10N.286.49.B3 TaxID=1880855 RepID=UPI000C81DB57|nr:ABC transporter substrate-binding protein [Vibrio sp. 10N.286.49.B3]PMH44478.1 ferric anguibactin-binding protein [Vibrio sp. 10N.286.49.B3]